MLTNNYSSRLAWRRVAITLAIATVFMLSAAKTACSAPSLLDRGIHCESKRQFRCAESFYEQAHRADPTSSEAILGLGRLHFMAGRFTAAIAHFRHARDLQPTAPHPVIWLYLAELRAGQPAESELRGGAEAAQRIDWPGPVIAYFLGAIRRDMLVDTELGTPPSIRERARCESNLYLGEYDLGLDDNKKVAVTEFAAAVSTCKDSWREGALATIELRRLKALGFNPSVDRVSRRPPRL